MLRLFARTAEEILGRGFALAGSLFHRGLEAMQARWPHVDLSLPANKETVSYCMRFKLAGGGERVMRASVAVEVARWSYGGQQIADTAVRDMLWHLNQSNGGPPHWTPTLRQVAPPDSLVAWDKDQQNAQRFLAGEQIDLRIGLPLRLRDRSLPLRRNGDRVSVKLVRLDCQPPLDSVATLAPARTATRLAPPGQRAQGLSRR